MVCDFFQFYRSDSYADLLSFLFFGPLLSFNSIDQILGSSTSCTPPYPLPFNSIDQILPTGGRSRRCRAIIHFQFYRSDSPDAQRHAEPRWAIPFNSIDQILGVVAREHDPRDHADFQFYRSDSRAPRRCYDRASRSNGFQFYRSDSQLC